MRAVGERRREVLVRLVRTAAYEDPGRAARAEELLGDQERETLDRLRAAPARRDYLAAHVLVRTTLAELAGCRPEEICFGSSPQGRPEPLAPDPARRFRFSLSHADGIALCAITQRWAVGVDIESLCNVGPDPLGVAEIVCSSDEMAALRSLPASARADRLLFIWALKEAIAKASGLGFRFPLHWITIRTAAEGPISVEMDSGLRGGVSRARLACWRVGRRHIAAVAVLGEPRTAGLTIRLEVAGPWATVRRPLSRDL
jgi:4'-phosphopantetheinyl transferase